MGLRHFRITGGLFNPSVSLALFLVGGIGPLRFVLYVIAQLAGGISATAILLALLPGPLAFGCAPGPGVSFAQATIIEMFLTAAVRYTQIFPPFTPVTFALTVGFCGTYARC
jgi:aquaporin related protein